MKGGGIHLSGQYSRLAPRYPVTLECSLVQFVERRRVLRRRREEVVFSAEIFEISVNGAGVVVRLTPDSQKVTDVKAGTRVTVRLNERDGVAAIRHVHLNQTEVRFGIEFLNVAQNFRHLINGILAELRDNGRALEGRWESSH